MLRIPNLTLDDHFKLEDFQHDFTAIMDILAATSKNAKAFGITGVETNDDTDKIQELFNERGNIYFPKGTYILTKIIDVYSDTTITLDPEAIFVRKHPASMFQTATTTETTGYEGQKNIIFNSGVYKHDGNEDGSNVFSIFHAQDITFNNVVCLNTVGSHGIDVVASKNVKVLHCKFRGYKAVVETPNKEAIQIDAAGSAAYPIYDPSVNAYDGTPTCNVLIDGCEFTPSDEYPSFPSAVGQHGQHQLKGSRYKNITVVNNYMYGDPSYTYSYGIKPIAWENATIANNHIENYGCCIYADMFEKIVGSNGELIKDTANFPTVSEEDTLFLGCRNIAITGNILNAAATSIQRPGVWFNTANSLITSAGANSPKHRNISITGNTIVLPSPSLKSVAVDFDLTEDVVISGNTFINKAKSDSIGVQCSDYCKNIIIGDNLYKDILPANYHSIKLTCENIKRKGKTTLWTGKVFASGENITLSDKISNYDAIMVEVECFGTLLTTVDFTTTVTQSIREFNMADSDSSLTMNYFEARLKKIDETTIQHAGNKTIKSSDNSIVIADETTYIKAIYGINY